MSTPKDPELRDPEQSVLMPGRHRMGKPAVLLSMHKLLKLGLLVNKLLSTKMPNGKLGIRKRFGTCDQ